MGIGFDPKIAPTTRSEPTAAESGDPARKKQPLVAEAMDKPKTLAEPGKAVTHPSRQMEKPAASKMPAPLDHEVSRIRQGLRAGALERDRTVAQALQLSMRYGLRRSRSSRRQALSILAELEKEAPELRAHLGRLRALLTAEGELQELEARASAAGCRTLTTLLEEEERNGSAESDRDRVVAALIRAALATGLVQIAVHFPALLQGSELSLADTLVHALGLAEEAVALAPEMPDGYSATGRVLLCSSDPEALIDAGELFNKALALDPEHDPAVAGLATLALERGAPEEALTLIDGLLKLGNSLPQALLARALALAALGRDQEAKHELERALCRAPCCGVLHLEAARVLSRLGDPTAAKEHEDRARELLADAYADLSAGLALG